jgi:hypothetical protein
MSAKFSFAAMLALHCETGRTKHPNSSSFLSPSLYLSLLSGSFAKQRPMDVRKIFKDPELSTQHLYQEHRRTLLTSSVPQGTWTSGQVKPVSGGWFRVQRVDETHTAARVLASASLNPNAPLFAAGSYLLRRMLQAARARGRASPLPHLQERCVRAAERTKQLTSNSWGPKLNSSSVLACSALLPAAQRQGRPQRGRLLAPGR